MEKHLDNQFYNPKVHTTLFKVRFSFEILTFHKRLQTRTNQKIDLNSDKRILQHFNIKFNFLLAYTLENYERKKKKLKSVFYAINEIDKNKNNKSLCDTVQIYTHVCLTQKRFIN